MGYERDPIAAESARAASGAGESRALWYVGPRRAELRRAPLAAPEAGQIRVATLWSGISRGTERLVYGGLTDPAHRDRMRAPMQEGDFPFPVKYGYCVVGRVAEGPEALVGRHIFALHPHQDHFLLPQGDAVPLPDTVPPRRATLAANMETALNAVWDSGVSAGDRVVVVGAGLVGLLITYLAAQFPGTEVIALDLDPSRRKLVEAFGARFAGPECGITDADVVLHASATSDGLETALKCCGDEATLVEVSWYGDHSVTVGLGGPFHAKRLRLVSSQVGAVPPARQPRWSVRRRLEKALDLLADPRLDGLITQEIAFEELPGALPALLGTPSGIATAVRYT